MTKCVDLFIPLAKGGSHSIENLVMACRPCNAKKKDKMPERFLKEISQ